MTTLIIILSILLILRLTFDWLWIKKFGGMKPLPKIIATGICMLTAGTWVVFHVTGFWNWLIVFVISSLVWAFVFDKLRNLINRKNPLYMSTDTWPDKWILKYFNNAYLYNFFLIISIGFFWGMFRNVEFKTKKR